MSFDGLLVDRARIIRLAMAADSLGGQKRTEAIMAVNVHCRVEGLKGMERAMLGSQGVAVTHRIYMRAPACGVTEADELEIGQVLVTRYLVRWVNNVAGHHLELDCEEYRDGRS